MIMWAVYTCGGNPTGNLREYIRKVVQMEFFWPAPKGIEPKCYDVRNLPFGVIKVHFNSTNWLFYTLFTFRFCAVVSSISHRIVQHLQALTVSWKILFYLFKCFYFVSFLL